MLNNDFDRAGAAIARMQTMNTTQLERGNAIRKELAKGIELEMAVLASCLTETTNTYVSVVGTSGYRADLDLERHAYLKPIFEQFGTDVLAAIVARKNDLEHEFEQL